jgi:MOSC domain-containing protein YiiM
MPVMSTGRITGIFIAPEEGAPIEAVTEVKAVPGRGLEGDRYYKRSEDPAEQDPTTELTLITSEGLELARTEHGLVLDPGEHRRNVVTEGVNLLDLINTEFAVGDVRLRGLEDNPTCRYLAELTGKNVVKPLVRHGGIRAQILNEGTIRIGDTLEP